MQDFPPQVEVHIAPNQFGLALQNTKKLPLKTPEPKQIAFQKR